FADRQVGERERRTVAEAAHEVDPREDDQAAFAAFLAVDPNSSADSPTTVWGFALEAAARAASADSWLIEYPIAGQRDYPRPPRSFARPIAITFGTSSATTASLE